MKTVKAGDVRDRFYRLLNQTAEEHQPILITGPRANAVLVSEEDWNAIQATLHLLSIPEGLATPIEHCATEPDYRIR